MSAKPVQHDAVLPAAPCDGNFQERFTYMETIVGRTPEEGLRKDFSEMKKILHSMEIRIYIAMGALAVIVWILEQAKR